MVTHSISSSRVLYLVAGIAAFLVAVFAALYYTANKVAVKKKFTDGNKEGDKEQ